MSCAAPGAAEAAAALAAALEGVINGALRLEPERPAGLQPLHGKAVAVAVSDLSLGLTLRFDRAGVMVEAGAREGCDVTVRGKAFALLRMASAEQRDALLHSGEVAIAGDGQTLRSLEGLLAHARPDPEALLARLVGDAAARPLAQGATGLLDWLAAARHKIEQDLAGYLRHELDLLPLPEEVRAFAGQVDRLRDDVARLEQRVRQLLSRAAS